MLNFSPWEIIKSFWPLWVMLIIIALLRILFEIVPVLFDRWENKKRFESGQKWRSDRDLISWLRGMRPWEFEKYISVLFKKLGYKTETVGGAYDGGVDVIAEKDDIKHLIQCKKFITREVTVGAVRDFYGAIADHLTNSKGYFITTNKFTLEAEKFADDKPIELIDSFKLIKYIRMAEEKNKETASASIENKFKICPKCGGNLIERKGKFGKFLGCSNYPKCQYTEKI